MAVRQYIGARYVPKFYENSLGTAEWQAGVIYEPLTIVTYNGNSYTSKKTVAADIGNPSDNPSYWVATGNFNEQLADVSGRLASAEEDIDNAETDIATLKKKCGYYTPEMFGAVGDGVTDDYNAFNAMLGEVEQGDLILLCAKTYYVSQQLNINKNFIRISGIAISEYSPVIITDIDSGALFKVTGAGCVFDNLQISGPSRGATTACAIDFDGSVINGDCDGTVENCVVYRFEYGIKAGGRNVVIRNCNISAPRYGIVWYQLLNAVEHRGHIVDNCRFHGVPVGIKNEINNTLHVKNLTIKNNIFDGESATIFSGYSGGLTVKNNVLYIVPTTGGAGNIIQIDENADSEFADRDVIEGNVLHIAGKQYAGIAVNGAVKAIIKNNFIENTARRGIYTTGSADVIIANNIIDTATSWAIECAAATTGAIANNIIANSTYTVTAGGTTETGTVTVS